MMRRLDFVRLSPLGIELSLLQEAFCPRLILNSESHSSMWTYVTPDLGEYDRTWSDVPGDFSGRKGDGIMSGEDTRG